MRNITKSVLASMALLTIMSTAATTASAQGYSPPTLVTDPREVAACLCLDRALPRLANELTLRRLDWEAAVRRVDDLEAAVDDRRRIVMTEEDRDALRVLLSELDGAVALRDLSALPLYQSIVTRYNNRVVEHTERCALRVIDPFVAEKVRPNLVCPDDGAP